MNISYEFRLRALDFAIFRLTDNQDEVEVGSTLRCIEDKMIKSLMERLRQQKLEKIAVELILEGDSIVFKIPCINPSFLWIYYDENSCRLLKEKHRIELKAEEDFDYGKIFDSKQVKGCSFFERNGSIFQIDDFELHRLDLHKLEKDNPKKFSIEFVDDQRNNRGVSLVKIISMDESKSGILRDNQVYTCKEVTHVIRAYCALMYQ